VRYLSLRTPARSDFAISARRARARLAYDRLIGARRWPMFGVVPRPLWSKAGPRLTTAIGFVGDAPVLCAACAPCSATRSGYKKNAQVHCTDTRSSSEAPGQCVAKPASRAGHRDIVRRPPACRYAGDSQYVTQPATFVTLSRARNVVRRGAGKMPIIRMSGTRRAN